MINPEINKAKHDFTPATSDTAYQNADELSDIVYLTVLNLSKKPSVAMRFKKETFTYAVNGAALLQNFMNARTVDTKP